MKPRMGTKTVSVSFELLEIRRALEGAHLMLNMLGRNDLPTEMDARRAPGVVAAVLTMAICRLSLLGRAVTGAVDPSTLLALHNERGPKIEAWEDSDVLLSEWSEDQRLAGAKKVLRTSRRRKRQ